MKGVFKYCSRRMEPAWPPIQYFVEKTVVILFLPYGIQYESLTLKNQIIIENPSRIWCVVWCPNKFKIDRVSTVITFELLFHTISVKPATKCTFGFILSKDEMTFKTALCLHRKALRASSLPLPN